MFNATCKLRFFIPLSDGVTVVTYDLVSDSRPHGSVEVSAHLLASVMQTILRRDCISRYNIIRSSLNFNCKLKCRFNSFLLKIDKIFNVTYLSIPSLHFSFSVVDCLGSLCDPLANCNSSTCFDCPVGTSLDAPVICRSSLPRVHVYNVHVNMGFSSSLYM